jgi:uroporphyrinogen-III synthase
VRLDGDHMAEPLLRVVAFESRRAVEMAALIRKQGADPFVAPSMREVPLAEQPAAREFARALVAGEVDVLVCLTGVGTRTLADAVEPMLPRERLATLLAATTIVARGPKPVAALRELGLTPALTVPEPNTWRELLAAIDGGLAVRGKRIVVQEYGVPNDELLAGLCARGATVTAVPVYRWALPEDVGPLTTAAERIAAGALDVALFTSATQATHLLQIADARGLRASLAAGLARAVVGSIGPVCSEALRAAGLPVDCEPTHPKMGPLVTETLRAARALLGTKRADC